MRKFLVIVLALLPFFLVAQPKPKNVILMIGDGMGLAQAYSAFTVNKGHLNMFTMPYTGFSKTYCADRYVTDSGAGGTSLATGHKANYHSIGLDSAWNPQPSLIKLAKKKGLSTSIVVTCDLTHATPASFVANVKDRAMAQEIALAYLDNNVDVFIGGGLDNFISKKRKDKLSLVDSLSARGYNMIYSLDKLSEAKGKTAAILYEGHAPVAEKRKDMLSKSVNKSLEIISEDKDGFFMMIEGSQIDFYSHTNQGSKVVKEVLDFDKVVGEVLDFAKKDGNTLVIVIADHETGGLTLPKGDINKGKSKRKWSTHKHTGVMVPIYAYGIGAENFIGVMENTDVFKKIKGLLNL